MRFALIFVVTGIGLLCLPSALTQDSTPPSPQAMPAQSPAQPTTAAPPAPVDQPADTTPRKYVELWNTGNFDQVPSLLSNPAFMVSHGSRILMKPALLRKVITVWRRAMPDLNFKIEDTVIQGDTVAMRLSFSGSYKERLFSNTAVPAPNNPRTVRATEMLIFHLKKGKIQQVWEEYDEVRMRTQMGGFWRTNEELEAAAASDAQSSKPAPVEAPPDEPSPVPPVETPPAAAPPKP